MKFTTQEAIRILILLLIPLLTQAQGECKDSVWFAWWDAVTVGPYVANKMTFQNYVNDGNFSANEYCILAGTEVINSTFNLGGCPCVDERNPVIGVLFDFCIRDSEWEETYAHVLTDSASFYSPEAIALFESFGVHARDDCEVDSFYVKDLIITPPGGIERVTGTKRFDIILRAVDATGKWVENTMIWIRDESGCI